MRRQWKQNQIPKNAKLLQKKVGKSKEETKHNGANTKQRARIQSYIK